jgi:hypothetical protein
MTNTIHYSNAFSIDWASPLTQFFARANRFIANRLILLLQLFAFPSFLVLLYAFTLLVKFVAWRIKKSIPKILAEVGQLETRQAMEWHLGVRKDIKGLNVSLEKIGKETWLNRLNKEVTNLTQVLSILEKESKKIAYPNLKREFSKEEGKELIELFRDWAPDWVDQDDKIYSTIN